MSLQLVKRVKAAITAFKEPTLLESHRFITCYVDSKLPKIGVAVLILPSHQFHKGTILLVQNMRLRVVSCELRIHVEKMEG